ncbi:MAG: hypothetical protein QGF25_06920 [Candidatus Woesearchaeota archaeon]|jgi:hypothetical protein|nr:hypothetical protein [Candidatus Woesearchaeota archaeon]
MIARKENNYLNLSTKTNRSHIIVDLFAADHEGGPIRVQYKGEFSYDDGRTRGYWYYLNKSSYSRKGRWLPKCPDSILQKANTRELRKDEVVLDIEEDTFEKARAKAASVTLELYRLGVEFAVWYTGSRGFHVHMFFKQMNPRTWVFTKGTLEAPEEYEARLEKAFSQEQRKTIRRAIIAKFGCDPAKQAGVISIEGAPHHKTGKPKVLVADITQREENTLPQGMFSYAAKREKQKTKMAKKWPSQKRTLTTQEFWQHPLIKWARTSPIPEGERHMKLLPRLAEIAIRAHVSDDEIKAAGNEMERQWPNAINVGENLLGWVDTLRNKKEETA